MSNTLLNSLTVASADVITAARSLEQNYNDAMLKIGAVDEFTKKSFLTQWTDNVKVVPLSAHRFCLLMNHFSNMLPLSARRKRTQVFYAVLSTVRGCALLRDIRFEPEPTLCNLQHTLLSCLRIVRSSAKLTTSLLMSLSFRG